MKFKMKIRKVANATWQLQRAGRSECWEDEGERERGGRKEEATLTLPTDVASSKVARQFAIL